MRVYLAGPIEICTEEEIFLWRQYVSSKVGDNIEIITPKYHLGSAGEIFEDTKTNVEMCDVVFAHLPKAINERRASYGTIFEISYGYALKKRVMIISDDEFVHKHPVMNHLAEMFYGLDSAIADLTTVN